MIKSDILYRSEKDASAWSKEKLKSLLVGLTFDGPEGMCMYMYMYSTSLVFCPSVYEHVHEQVHVLNHNVFIVCVHVLVLWVHVTMCVVMCEDCCSPITCRHLPDN